MTPNEGTANSKSQKIPGKTPLGSSYYGLLGLHPSASQIEIRRSYRERSKLYHPDTTDLPPAVANATRSNPERRLAYDLKIGYSRLNVIQSPPGFNTPVSGSGKKTSNSAYLDPTDRPLSPGEMFALFIMGASLIGCLVLAIAIGLIRGN